LPYEELLESRMSKVTMVVAAAADNVIGRKGELPWRLPEDLRRFKELTMGKPIVMGRRTFESIGRPLPGRRNIVVSRRPGLRLEGCEVSDSPDAALALAGQAEEVMVIGGQQLYEAFLPRATRIHMTRVHETIEGDAFFPQLPPDEWQVVWSESHPATREQPLAHTFEILERPPPAEGTLQEFVPRATQSSQ
jgi:dihydrofolate reductase